MYGPGVDYSARDLSNLYLGGFDFTGAKFTSTTISNTVLSGSTLINANFAGANLENSYLNGTVLTGAVLTGVRLSGASFDSKTQWPSGFDYLHAGMFGPGVDYSARDLSSQYIAYNDFTAAIFTGANLSGAVLSGSTLVNANFTGANLSGAALDGTDLSGATLVCTDLRGADLSGAKIGRASIRSIIYDQTTKWPEGYAPPSSPATKSQTITFKAPAAQTFGNAPFKLTASSSSKLPFTFFSSDTTIARISGTSVTISGAGTVTLGCLAEGNATYLPSMPVYQKVVIAKASQKITFPKLTDRTFGSSSITLSATAPGGVVTYSSSSTNVATVSSNTLAIMGVGTTTITATQAGSRNYLPAADIPQIQKVVKAAQTLTFAPPPTVSYTKGATFSLTATTSSGLAGFIYTTKNTTVLQITGSQAKIVGKGNAVITVSEPGNANILSAKSISATVKVQ